MLIKGGKLNQEQRKQVLEAFGYRWTVENSLRATWWSGLKAPTIKPISDAQWLQEHAFHFTADGKRLKARPKYCEPAYMADDS